jgi:hypothetical protein
LDGQRYPILKFDGQNQTKPRIEWSKNKLILKINKYHIQAITDFVTMRGNMPENKHAWEKYKALTS